MATTITVLKSPALKDPKWAVTSAKAGDEVELSVTAENAVGMEVCFEIRNAAGHILAILTADGSRKAKWKPPMTPDVSVDGIKYTFFALLRQKPTPANGHLAVIQRLKSINELAVRGTRITDLTVDACFVPKHEKFSVKFKVQGEAPAKGQIEIWGERYPTDKPIYAEDFVPASGDNTWNTWYGGKHPSEDKGKISETGPLKDKYLSPEFSPYRIRVIAGPDDDAAMAETQFEIKFESLQIRIMQGLNEPIAATADNRRFRLENVLALGDREDSGKYGAMGRLPCLTMWQATFWVASDGDRDFDVSTVDASLKFKKGANQLGVWRNDTKLTLTTDYTEEGDADDLVSKIKLSAGLSKKDDTLLVAWVDPTSIPDSAPSQKKGRIRIPMARHSLKTEEMDMAGTAIGSGYIHASGVIKYVVDAAAYTRPELPIEIVPLLKSKVDTKNAAPYHGVFEPEAVGPLKVEPVAEDNYHSELYVADSTGNAEHAAFFRHAHHKIKKGASNFPDRAGTKPVFQYWQWRMALTADNTADTELNSTDPTTTYADPSKTYKVGADELIVWLNRTKLVKDVDYTEVGGGGSKSSKIKLKKGVGKNKDVIWVVRSESAATTVPGWKSFPPGTNCHRHYGGLRGKDPSTATDRLFLKNFSAAPGGSRDPIIGKDASGDLPFKEKDFIQLKPDPVLDNAQERVELTALLTGAKKGLAGVIFSPSYMGGDSYVLRARLDIVPYERNWGDVSTKPSIKAETGALTNWRWCQINKSVRCPDVGGEFTLRATVGSDKEPLLASRSYKGVGNNVNLDVMNKTLLPKAFSEWTVPLPIPITAATNPASPNPIQITTSVPHGLSTGEHVKIWGVKGNTNANGDDIVVTKVDDTNFTLNTIVGNAAYVSGGLLEPLELHKDMDLEEYVTRHDSASTGLGTGGVSIRTARNMIIADATNASPIEISTRTPHRFVTGDRVTVAGVTGNTAVNGVHLISVAGPKKFSLNGSTGNAAYVSGGTATLADFPDPAAITGATKATPIVITAAGHGFATGETVQIAGVGGNVAANGSHVITRLGPDTFHLNGVAGTVDYTTGGVATVTNIMISAATNVNPIQVTTSAPHRLHTRERVTISGVGGNSAANGSHKITVVDGNNFTLDGVAGNGAYTSGGTVKTRDFHHRNITDCFVQFDPYRAKLPPVGFSGTRVGVVTRVIQQMCASGDLWADVKALIDIEVGAWTGPDYAIAAIPNATETNLSDYVVEYLLGRVWIPIARPIVDHFTPPDGSPKTMSLVRWPLLHDQSYRTTWEGQCLGHGQALIHSLVADRGSIKSKASTTLYSHEMGHSMHLVHFLGGNFGWKHHDLNFPQCMMSYSHISKQLDKPTGGVGGGGSLDSGGWPDGNKKVYRALRDIPLALDKPCARCMLKLQGWDERKLPAAWNHPDLF